MNDIISIKNYILYLKKECSLAVTLHSCGSHLILKKDLLAFNIHENPYCIFVKTCKAAQAHCIEKQAKVAEKCKDGSFCGVCYAGVKEFVYPIRFNNKVVGFICVSGFLSKNGEEYVSNIAKKYNFSYKELLSSYKTLKTKMPEKAYVDTLIYPLCHMLELAHIKAVYDVERINSFIHRVTHYLKQYYTQEITSETICREFHCSRSNLSRIFNQQTKMSIRDYINTLRIESAKALLRDTKLEIAEIAFSVGFSEPNYFTSVFKKYTNLSPSAYRKSQLLIN
jgi:AraC-like DNA-binding protein